MHLSSEQLNFAFEILRGGAIISLSLVAISLIQHLTHGFHEGMQNWANSGQGHNWIKNFNKNSKQKK